MNKLKRFNALSEKQIIYTLLVNFVFAVLEIVIGVFSNSLVLVANALHNSIDVFALGIALIAAKKAGKDPTNQNTFGFTRATVIASVFTSSILIFTTIIILLEAIKRFSAPPQIIAGPVFWVGVVGFAINTFVALRILKNKKDLNIKSLFVHVADDALGWFAVIVSSTIILFTGFTLIDPILTILVAIIIMWAAIKVLKESIDVLMEGAPKEINTDEIRKELSKIQRVQTIHDLHVWSISPHYVVLSCHVAVEDMPVIETQKIAIEIKKTLYKKFRIIHSTIEFECSACQVIDGELVCQ